MIPFGLFSPLDDSAFLLHKSFYWLENWFIYLFVTVAEYLDSYLNVTLFNFIVGSF